MIAVSCAAHSIMAEAGGRHRRKPRPTPERPPPPVYVAPRRSDPSPPEPQARGRGGTCAPPAGRCIAGRGRLHARSGARCPSPLGPKPAAPPARCRPRDLCRRPRPEARRCPQLFGVEGPGQIGRNGTPARPKPRRPSRWVKKKKKKKAPTAVPTDTIRRSRGETHPVRAQDRQGEGRSRASVGAEQRVDQERPLPPPHRPRPARPAAPHVARDKAKPPPLSRTAAWVPHAHPAARAPGRRRGTRATPAPVPQQPRHDEAVAAVVAGPQSTTARSARRQVGSFLEDRRDHRAPARSITPLPCRTRMAIRLEARICAAVSRQVGGGVFNCTFFMPNRPIFHPAPGIPGQPPAVRLPAWTPCPKVLSGKRAHWARGSETDEGNHGDLNAFKLWRGKEPCRKSASRVSA